MPARKKTTTTRRTTKKKVDKVEEDSHSEVSNQSDSEHASESPSEHEDNVEVEKEEVSEVSRSSWVAETSNLEETNRLPDDSIANFNHDEVLPLENEVVKDLSFIQLLKVLVVRGSQNYNPALAAGAERLLRQLNRETIRAPRSRNPKPNNAASGNGNGGNGKNFRWRGRRSGNRDKVARE